eukprot:scaffold155923_cov28-Attheya_sp.AAC.1
MDEADSFADLDLNEEDIEDATHVGVTPHAVPRSASPGTSQLFSSPSSTTSGLTGGWWWSGNSDLLSFRQRPMWCSAIRSSSRGASGTRFCCKAADMCTIQSHQNQKVAIQEGTIYLQGPRLGQARLEPSLNINQLLVEIPLTELLEMQKP